MTERLVRKPEVLKDTGLSHTTLYRLIKNGGFPAPIRISTRISVWQVSQIEKWIEERINDAHPAPATSDARDGHV